MTQFYIHIGMHKTGTTSIQATLFNSRDRLLEEGINYLRIHQNHSEPLFSLFTDKPHTYHMNVRLGLATQAQAEQHNDGIRQKLLKELKANRSKRFVVSGEDLSLLSAAGVARMKATFDPYAAGYKIIIYVREPYEFIQSAGQERLRAGVTLEKLGEKPVLPKYRSRIEKYIQAFGRENVDIRIFKTERFAGGNLIADFLIAIEARPDLIGELDVVRANEALSHEAALILDEANKLYPRRADRTFGAERARDLPTRLTTLEGETFAPSPLLPERLEASVREDVEWLHSVIGRPVFAGARPAAQSNTLWSTTTVRSLGRLLNDMAREIEQKQAEIEIQQARLALVGRQYREAERHFREAVRLRPDDALTFHELSRICASLGRLDHALDAARKAAALNPEEPHRGWLQRIERANNSQFLRLAYAARRVVR